MNFQNSKKKKYYTLYVLKEKYLCNIQKIFTIYTFGMLHTLIIQWSATQIVVYL